MADRKKLLWKLFPSYLLITIFSMLAVAMYASKSIKEMYTSHLESELISLAHAFSMMVPQNLESVKHRELDGLCKAASKKMGVRTTVILPDGTVICDSQENPEHMSNHRDRPEVKKAITNGIGVSIRKSTTLKIPMLYVAISCREGEQLTSIVRVSTPVAAINTTMKSLYSKLAVSGLMVAVVAAIISFVVSRRITTPIVEMKRVAEKYAAGELNEKVYVPDIEEMAILAEAMNEMAAQLYERMMTVTEQRNELEAVLSSMIEAVMVIDSEEKIVRLNHSMRKLLGIGSIDIAGRSLHEVVRNHELQQLASKVLTEKSHVSSELEIYMPGERYLQASATVLKDSDGKKIGAIIVLNDITRLKRLEKISRDFVANVSHELKTPITSIKCSIETLKEGGIGDPENAGKFIDIIIRHTDRLNAIIDDILTLSRIEESEQQGEIFIEETPVLEILRSASSVCMPRAEEKKIEINITCPDYLMADVNRELMEQAVINLLDNAIKFSEPETSIRVEASQTENEVTIEVEDRGCGIPQEHLPRIFERFYRVDKARSRKAGGTGLGLAIVKHIATSHRGSVSVESTPGRGSIFRIHIPRKTTSG